ncbi:MAG TPA: hypothetical protein VIN03_22270 [Roseateles sp.]
MTRKTFPFPRRASMAGRVCAVLAIVCGWSAAPPSVAETGPLLPALNSYAQPPFTLPDDRAGGLAASFLALLNEEAGPAARFRLEPLPRRRLEVTLDTPAFSGLALFLAPEFLPGQLARSGEWSAPVMVDENLLVSVRPLAVPNLDALTGLRFGAIAGHVYRVLGPLAEAGRIERADAPDHVANLKKLCLDRVDFVVISRSELAGTSPLAECARPWRVTSFPEPQVIVRRVLVRMPEHKDTQAVLGAVARVACGERWRAALAAYGLSTAGCAPKAAGKP